MESQLQQMLGSLCFDTGWKYAIFWKLKHQEQMILTWEDAYYDGNLYPDQKFFIETAQCLNYGPYSHDLLGLSVAKMSYQVYSLGEGIIGQAAASGKHSWIYSEKHVTDFSSTSETFDGWQNQFSAGVKTIAVVAVIPHGVVQLGSLHKITEDLKLINHIRNVFSDLQDSLADGIHSSLHSTLENSCLLDVSARIPNSAGNHDHKMTLDNSFHDDGTSLCSQLVSSIGSNHASISPLLGSSLTLKMKMHERAECSMPENEISLPSSSESILTRKQSQEAMGSFCEIKCGEETNDLKDLGKRPEISSFPAVKNVKGDNLYFCDATLPTDGHQMNLSCLPLENLDSLAFRDRSEFYVPESPSEQLHPDFERNLELESKFNNFETRLSPFSFCAGYELYEALGPSFRKQNGNVWEEQKNNSDMVIENPERMGSRSLLMENPDMHLLDALVAKASGKDNDANSVKSCRESEESLRTPCISVGTISSTGYSFDRATSSSLNSVPCGIESLKGLLSPISSGGSELLERPREPVKMNKKRTRTGENSRPRPRDRQLIQDRIKELRVLVPSGSKCSIDSLLERTIKHMLFLQSITKHAEKLHKCSASKLLDKNTDMRGFSSEQGSSWAMEVGNNSKVCPIIVENINMHGQMLVEMLCERCSQFLDIAATIRSLGLTILKGVSEAYGNKTWMCFVVEGQNNKSMHRMDVLWSLMQILQSKISS